MRSEADVATEAWQIVNSLIEPGALDGTGRDPVAQRNGFILAANELAKWRDKLAEPGAAMRNERAGASTELLAEASPSVAASSPAGFAPVVDGRVLRDLNAVPRARGTEQNAPIHRGLHDDLSPSVEARLTEEVDRLITALRQFAARAKSIGEAAPGGGLDQLVPVLFSLVGLQFANAFSRDTKGLGLLCCSPEYFEQLHLKLSDAVREVRLDGRRFLAVALVDQEAGELLRPSES
jgi:hypothetical protein